MGAKREGERGEKLQEPQFALFTVGQSYRSANGQRGSASHMTSYCPKRKQILAALKRHIGYVGKKCRDGV